MLFDYSVRWQISGGWPNYCFGANFRPPLLLFQNFLTKEKSNISKITSYLPKWRILFASNKILVRTLFLDIIRLLFELLFNNIVLLHELFPFNLNPLLFATLE